MATEGVYELETAEGRIVLRAFSFKADRGSVLHSGIFSKELASSFLAAIAAVIVLFLIALKTELKLIHFVLVAVIFMIVFPLARMFVFKEPYLETLIDRYKGTILMKLVKPLGEKKVHKDLSLLKHIAVDHIRIEPENPDGVAFVEKIALQHGTVIPGFGQVQEFYNVNLMFDDANYTIVTVSNGDVAQDIVNNLKEYAPVKEES